MYYVMVYNLFIKHNNNIQQFHATYNNTGYQIDIKTYRDCVWCNHQVLTCYTYRVRTKPAIVRFNIYYATVYDTDFLYLFIQTQCCLTQTFTFYFNILSLLC